MEREGPNVRPARLDFPESGGGWAILGISYDALLHACWLRARCEDKLVLLVRRGCVESGRSGRVPDQYPHPSP